MSKKIDNETEEILKGGAEETAITNPEEVNQTKGQKFVAGLKRNAKKIGLFVAGALLLGTGYVVGKKAGANHLNNDSESDETIDADYEIIDEQ